MQAGKRKRVAPPVSRATSASGKSIASELVQNAPRLRTGGRSQEIAARVEKATREILSEASIQDVTFESIAARAQVNRATLRRRWGDKWRLVTWVLLEVMAREAPLPNKGSLRDDVLAAILNLDRAFNDGASGAFFQVLFVESRSNPVIRQAVDEYWAHRFEHLRPIFDRAVGRGELPEGADFDFTIDAIFGPYFYHSLRTGKPVSRKYAKRLVDAAMIVVREIDLG